MVIFSTWPACLSLASCSPTPSVYLGPKCLCIGSVSCSPLTLGLTLSLSDFFLSDHLPLLLATTSLRTGVIQVLFLHDEIKCSKHFSDQESLMAVELHVDSRNSHLLQDLPVPHCSGITNHCVPFLGSCYKRKDISLWFFISLFFSLFLSNVGTY